VSRPACERDRIVAKLRLMRACGPSIDWVREQPRNVTLADLWRTCPDWQWLDWFRLELLGFDTRCPICARDFGKAHTESTYRAAVGWTGWYDIKRAWEAL
jgi:hypothetical protein